MHFFIRVKFCDDCCTDFPESMKGHFQPTLMARTEGYKTRRKSRTLSQESCKSQGFEKSQKKFQKIPRKSLKFPQTGGPEDPKRLKVLNLRDPGDSKDPKKPYKNPWDSQGGKSRKSQEIREPKHPEFQADPSSTTTRRANEHKTNHLRFQVDQVKSKDK